MSSRESSCLFHLEKRTPSLADTTIVLCSPEKHLQRLRPAFERFGEINMKTNPDKCDVFRMKRQMLRKMVSNDGAEAAQIQIEAVQTFPVPKS